MKFSSTSKMWRKQIPLVFGVRFKAGGAYNTLPRVEVNYVVKNFYLSLRARTPVNVRQVVDATLLLAACAHGRLHGSVEDFAAAATRMFLRYREHGAVNQASLDVQIPQNEGVSDVDSESLEDGVVSQSMRIKFETGTEIGTKAEENVSSVFVKMEPGEVSYIPAKKEGQENSLVPVKTEPHDTIGGSSHDVEHGIAAPLAAHVEHEDNVIQGNWDLKRRSRKLSLSTVEKKLKL
ncbi:hypothetical protein BC830DRAFT_683812 [Chytriomyces sp. MP71]|nr:hypothetical protein BC830DRAFT_683812 [Chytriomyces sp. MP71]